MVYEWYINGRLQSNILASTVATWKLLIPCTWKKSNRTGSSEESNALICTVTITHRSHLSFQLGPNNFSINRNSRSCLCEWKDRPYLDIDSNQFVRIHERKSDAWSIRNQRNLDMGDKNGCSTIWQEIGWLNRSGGGNISWMTDLQRLQEEVRNHYFKHRVWNWSNRTLFLE